MHRLAAFGLLIALVATSVACARHQDGSPLEARLSFQDVPNGAAPLDFGGAPGSIRTDPADDTGAALRVIDGKLTNEPTTAGRTASYFTSADLGGPVTTIGARWTFTPRGGTSGTMALVVSQAALDFPFSVHLVVTPELWSFGVWPPKDAPSPGLHVLQTERFDAPLVQDGRHVLEASVEIEGPRVDIALPNGERRVISDQRINDWAGRFATFEAFSDRGLTDSRVGFSEIWAKSRP